MLKAVNILNKKARFHYELLEKYTAGIKLNGTEIKSIRHGKARIVESFCEAIQGELFVINMYIEEYEYGTYNNHQVKRNRKLLLNRREITKIEKKVKNAGLTIIPTRLFINEKGLAKLDIHVAKGKKLYDKRQALKDREVKRDISRTKKNRI
ncbi:SsrA-binding protein SmpB [Ichthyobacterium seriolicida]|uniref:SsrA-binding protein n=1 Tax=Ichthyobacterium seriolicida TaxID=242600 RepID=A0A1J1E833_9FLAO|nr:SsrA-binding protein SmpB [Ichthyobacterium seriolicida]BAV94091.1 single-stranded DNA binding protein [Ichthyobacterium seriolicida]